MTTLIRAGLALCLALCTGHAAAQIRDPLIRSVSVSPSRVTVGGQFTLSATRVNYADGECRANIGRDVVARPRIVDGQISATVTLPLSIPRSNVVVELFCQRPLEPTATKLGEAPLSIVPAIALGLAPTGGAAGQRIDFTASGLIGSSFELWFGALRVYGPVPVGRTASVSGRFIVPKSTSVNYPVAATVVARSLSGRLATGRGTAAFSQTSKPTYRTRFLSPTAPTSVDTLQPVSLSGKVEASDGTPQTRTVNVYWKGDDGRVVPLGRRDVAVAADGSFATGADLPSEFTQDGYRAQGSGKLVYTTTEVDGITGRTVTTTHETQSIQTQPLQNFTDSARARVRVLKPNGQPLERALVEVAGGADVLRDPDAANTLSAGFGPLNQLQDQAGQAEVVGCPLSLARGYTDANGYFEFLISRQAAADYALQQTTLGAVCRFADGRGGNDQDRCVRNTAVNATLTIYTGHLGFGQIRNGVIEPYVIPAEFRLDPDNPEASRFWHPEGNVSYNQPGVPWLPVVNTSVVEPGLQPQLYRRRAGATGFDTGSGAFEPYPTAIDTATDTGFADVGRIFDVKTATPQGCGNPDTICVQPGLASFELNYLHDFVLSGTVQSAKLVLCSGADTFDCASGTDVEMTKVDDLSHCGVSGYEQFQAKLLPDQMVNTGGRLRGRLVVTSSYQGQPLSGKRRFGIGLDDLPSWFNGNEPGLKNREVRLGPDGRTSFFAVESLTGGSPHAINFNQSRLADYNLDAEQRNSTSNTRDIRVYQQNRNEAPSSRQSDLRSTNEVANNGADDTVVRAGTGGAIPTREIIFIDTGEVPLFRYTWGIPPIADATVGADFWLQAGMNYGGSFGAEASATSPPQVTFFTEPFMDLGIDIFFDLEILFGIVSAEVTASPLFSLAMKSSYTTGGYSPPSPGVDECAVFRLDLTWEVCAVFCEGDTEQLFRYFKPQSDYCEARSILPFDPQGKGAADYRARPRASMAIDASGWGAALVVDDTGFNVYEWPGAFQDSETPKPLDTVGPAVTSSAMAIYGYGTGVALWSRIPGSPTSIDQASRNSHVMWAKVSQGGTQYVPQTLTSAGAGDGNVAMAACPDWNTSCPDGGEVTAVWVRRLGSSYAAHHYAVMYARYTHAGGWTSPARIDAAQGFASDTQPTVVYRAGVPIVAWVRKPAAGLVNAATTRIIAYRALDGSSPVRTSPELGTGVAWPSLSIRRREAGILFVQEVLLAYTIPTDPAGFVGSHNALHVARATCASGTCTWTHERLRDQVGRAIMAERPTIVGQQNGDVALNFRGLGFGRLPGGSRFRPGDPPGMITGAGENITVRPKLDGTPVSIVSVTADASGAVRPAFAFDPSNGVYVSVSQPGPEIPANVIRRTKALTPNPIAKASRSKLANGFIVAEMNEGPDLGVTSITTQATAVAPGGTVRVEAKLENFGADYVAATGANYTLVATWDEPEATADTAALSQVVASLASSRTRTLALDVPVPAGFRADDVHTLFVTLRPDATVEEANAIDNERMLSIGAMPIPRAIKVTLEPGQPVVFLTWSLDAPDARVAGYRVMLVDAEGNRKALGSSPVQGFADFAAAIGEARSYVVASYSANGVESAESDVVTVVPPAAPVESGGTTLLSDGFEGP